MIVPLKSTRALGEVAKVISGYAFKSAEFGEEGVPVIKIKNIRVGTVDLDDAACVNGRFLKLDPKYHVNPGDLLISLTGSHPNQPNSVVGRVARMGSHQPLCLLNQRAGKIYLRKGAAGDIGYLYYVLSSPEFRSAVAMLANGAASQANVSPTQVESLEIPFPDLATQRKIADILSGYDDLIANNLRRIKILEEMAQSLYREWFVNFRFSGFESARFIESPLGHIPKGWNVTTVVKQFTTTLGGTPSRNNDSFWIGGTIPWINSGKVNELRVIEPTCLITDDALRRSAAKLMPARTTVVAITGATLGQVSLLEIECSANQSVIGITDENSTLSEWLYLFFSNKIQEIIQHASGGAQQHINKDIVNDVSLVLPDDKTADAFKRLISPIFNQQFNLLRRNQNLRRTRDLLLPKLLQNDSLLKL